MMTGFKLYCKALVIKTVWYWHKNRHTDQQNSSEINLHIYEQLIYNKGAKNIQQKKNSLFNKWCRENCTAICKDHCLTPYTKIKSKRNIDLNVIPKTVKFLEENIGNNLIHIVFCESDSKPRKTKAKINKWDYIKIINCCTVKEIITKTKRQPIEWEKIFANHIFNKRFVSKIYKELTQFNNQKTPKQPS